MPETGRIRPIVTIGDPVLATPCREVTAFDDELRTLVADMFATMYDAPGVGLAANQIGVDLQVFVIDCPDSENGSLVGHVVNPRLEPAGEDRELEIDDEGCLSIPGPYTDVPRLKHAVVTGLRLLRHPGAARGARAGGALPAARDRPPRRLPLRRPAAGQAAAPRAARVRSSFARKRRPRHALESGA